MKKATIYPVVSTTTTGNPWRHLSRWERFVEILPWEQGSLDSSTYKAALRAASLGIEPDIVFSTVTSKIEAAGGHVRPDKIEAQINRAYAYAAFDKRAAELRLTTGLTVSFSRPRKWSEPDRELIEKTQQDYGRLTDLWEASPTRFTDDYAYTETVIDVLFPGNPWLCVGFSQTNFVTLPREKLRGRLNEFPLIVPSPMRAQHGLTLDGRKSMHCADNVGPRKFIIVEFDDGSSLDKQAGRLLHLRERAPLAMVVFSGNKSLQGWFFCLGQDEERLRDWFDYALRLGADEMMWTPCQFCRMPDAWRAETSKSGDSGSLKQQTIYYFAPEAAEVAP